MREQLDARSLDSKGVKNILAQRLQEALDAEKASEETAGEEASVRKPKDESVDQDIVILDEIPKAADINPDELICKDDVDEKMDTSEAKVEEKPAYTKEEKDEHKREVDKFVSQSSQCYSSLNLNCFRRSRRKSVRVLWNVITHFLKILVCLSIQTRLQSRANSIVVR